MRAVILIFSLVIFSVQGSKRCKDCPANNDSCDQLYSIFRENCTCSVCVARCNVRDGSCEVGEECIEVPSYFSNKVQVAKCVPFSGCRNETCSNECPVSGYLHDLNGCNTCLCNNLCAELQCPNGCVMWITSTFMEPNVACAPLLPTTPDE